MPHRLHIYAKASNMAKEKICVYLQSDHALAHWEYLLIWCAKFPCFNLPDQETDDKYSNTRPSIRFHIYPLISYFTTHGRHPLNDNKNCCMCK